MLLEVVLCSVCVMVFGDVFVDVWGVVGDCDGLVGEGWVLYMGDFLLGLVVLGGVLYCVG